jgi:hypothetical protein
MSQQHQLQHSAHQVSSFRASGAHDVDLQTTFTILFTGAPSPAPGQASIRLESRLPSRVRTERLRAWSPNCACKACSSVKVLSVELVYGPQKWGRSAGRLRSCWSGRIMALKRTWSENKYYLVGVHVPSAASAPTLIETPRSIPTEPSKEDSTSEKSMFGSPTVPFTGVTLALASKVNSSTADASTLAKTVDFAAPFRISTPISRRGIKWASTRPVNAAGAPTSTLIAIQNL